MHSEALLSVCLLLFWETEKHLGLSDFARFFSSCERCYKSEYLLPKWVFETRSSTTSLNSKWLIMSVSILCISTRLPLDYSELNHKHCIYSFLSHHLYFTCLLGLLCANIIVFQSLANRLQMSSYVSGQLQHICNNKRTFHSKIKK